MKVFVSGRLMGNSWEFRGVYSSAENAERICNTAEDFVAPIGLDEDVAANAPTNSEWPGLYFPVGDDA